MWHASARSPYSRDDALGLAEWALTGVGDRELGEWVEQGSNGTVHLRRRLSAEEQLTVGDARDIRGTLEERCRVRALLTDAPHLAAHMPGIGRLA